MNINADSIKIKDFPAYLGSRVTVKAGRDGMVFYVIEDVSLTHFAAFLSSVEAAGWRKYAENNAGGNLFVTYTLGDHSVHMYYLPNVSRVHIIDMPLGAALPSTEKAAYTKLCEPLFTQIQLKYDAASEGDSYLLRLSDGRFIVVDGGMDEADYYESNHLYALMQDQNVLDKVTIAAWIITHAHADHHGTAGELLGRYDTDDLSVEQIVFNYPSEDDMISMNTSPTDTRYLTFLDSVQKWVDRGTQRVTCYTGQVFHYADAKIEFLHTYEAFAPGVLDGADINNTSAVFTIEIADQKIMMLGDMHHLGSDSLVELYGTYLKSDIMKLAHHGYPGGTYELYSLIDPITVFNSTILYCPLKYYSEFRYFQKDTTRGGQAYWWLYDDKEYPAYAYISSSNHVKEVITSAFKEVTVSLPYTPVDGCEYFANRQNNGYTGEEPAKTEAAIPAPYLDVLVKAQGKTANRVCYKGVAYTVDGIRVKKGDAAGTLVASIDDLPALVAGGMSLELLVAVDELPERPESARYEMFGNDDIGLTLENPTLNVNLTVGDTKVLGSTGLDRRYWTGSIVGGSVLNHIVGTYNPDGTMCVYQNGILVAKTTCNGDFAIKNNLLTIGSTAFSGLSAYTVLGARVYDTCLDAEQVAATYWDAVEMVTATVDRCS